MAKTIRTHTHNVSLTDLTSPGLCKINITQLCICIVVVRHSGRSNRTRTRKSHTSRAGFLWPAAMIDPGAEGVPESDWLYTLLADVQLEGFFEKIRDDLQVRIFSLRLANISAKSSFYGQKIKFQLFMPIKCLLNSLFYNTIISKQ